VAKNAVLNYEQQFYLSGVQLSGVTSIDGGYSIQEEPINIIGQGYVFPVRQGPLVGEFSISRYFIGEDLFLNFTGDHPISGSINFNDTQRFGFVSGYLNQYSVSAGVGSIPTSNASITVYGDIGEGINAYGTNEHPIIQIPNQGSITVDCSGYQTNRVTQFSYTMRIDREALYKIGSPYPIQVDRKCPIYQEASFEIECNDFEVSRIREYLVKPKMQSSLNLSFKNPINENSVETFTINNARLLDQKLSTSSDDLITINLRYAGYINTKS
jgi:hypothetical protein